MANNFLDKNGLLYLWQKITNKFVAKESGKGLSTNDFTTELKTKLDAIEAGAQKNVKPDWNAVSGTAGEILNKPTIPTKTSQLQNDSNFITVEQVPEGAVASNTVPKMDSATGSVGTETEFARGDHVHPSDSTKADKATTLAGYGITDAYTKTELDGKLSSTYKPGGSSDFASLPTPDAAHSGMVYSMTEGFTTDERFIEGAGKQYPIGTNVAVIQVMVEDTPEYKFDVLAGFVDLSGYMQKTDMVAITNEEIDQIVGDSGA